MPRPARGETELRSLLGCFLFSDDDVFKKIGVLSGGERGRYALLRLLLHPANFLLLDEPTNHLDLRAKDVLLDALMKYTGTVVFVSHDRYFIDKLATRVFEVGGGKVEVFPGNYEDYLWRKQGGQHVAPTLDDVPGARTAKTRMPQLPHWEKCGFAATIANQRRIAIGEADGRGIEEAPESHQAQTNGRPRPRTGRRNQPDRGCDRTSGNGAAEFRQRRRKPAPVAGTRPAQSHPRRADQGMGRDGRSPAGARTRREVPTSAGPYTIFRNLRENLTPVR